MRRRGLDSKVLRGARGSRILAVSPTPRRGAPWGTFRALATKPREGPQVAAVNSAGQNPPAGPVPGAPEPLRGPASSFQWRMGTSFYLS